MAEAKTLSTYTVEYETPGNPSVVRTVNARSVDEAVAKACTGLDRYYAIIRRDGVEIARGTWRRGQEKEHVARRILGLTRDGLSVSPGDVDETLILAAKLARLTLD